MVKARSADDLSAAEKQVTELLRQRHHIGQKQDNDFSVRNLTQIMQAAEQSSKVMTLLLGAIASVSLLVGGIGIMNIMLVSVTERTREIGIRMAIGAREGDIRTQFLVEAVALAVLGGLAGVGLGCVAIVVLRALLDWHMSLSLLAIGVSIAVSGATGVVFGFIPARRAASLDPIDALRHE